MNLTTENNKTLPCLNPRLCTTPSTCACHPRWIPAHLWQHKANATQSSGPQESHNGQKSRHEHPSLGAKDGSTPPFTFNHPDTQLKVVTREHKPQKKAEQESEKINTIQLQQITAHYQKLFLQRSIINYIIFTYLLIAEICNK